MVLFASVKRFSVSGMQDFSQKHNFQYFHWPFFQHIFIITSTTFCSILSILLSILVSSNDFFMYSFRNWLFLYTTLCGQGWVKHRIVAQNSYRSTIEKQYWSMCAVSWPRLYSSITCRASLSIESPGSAVPLFSNCTQKTSTLLETTVTPPPPTDRKSAG